MKPMPPIVDISQNRSVSFENLPTQHAEVQSSSVKPIQSSVDLEFLLQQTSSFISSLYGSASIDKSIDQNVAPTHLPESNLPPMNLRIIPKRVTRHKPRCFLTWREKEIRFTEAYMNGNTVTGTAKKYRITPKQIRNWKRKANEMQAKHNANPSLKRHMDACKKHRCVKEDAIYSKLRIVIERIHGEGRRVTISELSREMRRLQPNLTFSDRALYNRVRR